MQKGEHFDTGEFKIFSTTDKISPSAEIDGFSETFGVRNIPDSIFGANSLSVSHPRFSLLFSGKDSVRTLKTSPKQSIGVVNQFLGKSRAAPGKVSLSNAQWMLDKLAPTPSAGPEPVRVELEQVPFGSGEVLFVPFMTVKVASSSLWTNKTGEVSQKLGFSVGEEEIEQDWTYMNAYEGLLCWKGEAKGERGG